MSKTFREFYIDRHGEFPGPGMCPIDGVVRNLADALADYADQVIKAEVPTLRDAFAMAALNAIVADERDMADAERMDGEDVAEEAYQLADYMLAERSRVR